MRRDSFILVNLVSRKLPWLVFLVAAITCAQNPPRIISLSDSAAVPGTRLEAVVSGTASSVDLPYLVLAFPDGFAVPVPAIPLAAGRFSFIVPYVPDENDGPGYRIGACSMGLLSDKGQFIGETPFEIRELPETPGAIERFRTIVTNQAARTGAALRTQRSSSDLTEMVDVLERVGISQAKSLLTLVDKLAENKVATFPLDLTGSSDPDAPSIEVTERMVGHIVAVHDAILSSSLPSTAQAMEAKLQRNRSAGGPGCIFDALGGAGSSWDLCIKARERNIQEFINAEDSPLTIMFQRAFSWGGVTLLTPSSTKPCPGFNTPAITPGLLVGNLAQFLMYSGLYCNLHPIRPVKLTANPLPNPLPVGPFGSTGNQGTEIKMRLEPAWTPETAVLHFLWQHYDHVFLDMVSKINFEGCTSHRDKIFSHITNLFLSITPDIKKAVQEIQDRAPKFREVTLYKCDIEEVRPFSSDNLRWVPSWDDNNKLRWGLEGVRAGTTEVLLRPIPANFPRRAFTDLCITPPRPFGDPAEWQPVIPACVKIDTAGGEAKLGVSDAYVFSYQDEGPQNPKTYSPPFDVGAPYDLPNSAYGATASANVRQQSATKWVITQKATGAPATGNVVTTWNRLDLNLIHRPGPQKIRVKVNANVTGTCQGLDVYLGSIRQRKDGNNGCSADWTLEEFSPRGPTGSTLLLIRFVVLGGRNTSFGPGSGTVTTEVEYLTDTPF